MTQPFIHSRPAYVSDERLKENLEKQKKQQSFKEALDLQIKEKLRQNAGERSSKRGKKVAEPQPQPQALAEPVPKHDTLSVRYTLSFEGGKAQFQSESLGEDTKARNLSFPKAPSCEPPIQTPSSPPFHSTLDGEGEVFRRRMPDVLKPTDESSRHASPRSSQASPPSSQAVSMSNSYLTSNRHLITGATKKKNARTLPPLEPVEPKMESSAPGYLTDRSMPELHRMDRREHPDREISEAPREEVVDLNAQKEKDWAMQVGKLKEELRKARRQNTQLKEENLKNRRAETAPEGTAITKRDASLFPNRARYAHGGMRPFSTANPDFTRAQIFSAETFRRVETPPLEDPSLHHGSDDEAMDLPSPIKDDHTVNNTSLPQVVTEVPIALEHLLQFAQEQIITEKQATNLWQFFLDLHCPEATDVSEVVEVEVEVVQDDASPHLKIGSLLESSSTFDVREATILSNHSNDEYILLEASFDGEGEGDADALAANKPALSASLRKKITESRQTGECLLTDNLLDSTDDDDDMWQ